MSKKRSVELLKSVNTVTSEFIEDISLVIKKKLKKSAFFLKYGHLRPGAYDITSRNYSEIKNSLFEKSLQIKKHIFKLSSNEKNRLSKLLKKGHEEKEKRQSVVSIEIQEESRGSINSATATFNISEVLDTTHPVPKTVRKTLICLEIAMKGYIQRTTSTST